MSCEWTRLTWFNSSLALRTGEVSEDVGCWILSLHKLLPKDDFDLLVMTLWSIWKTRNDCLFNKAKPDGPKTLLIAQELRAEWLSCQDPKGSKDQAQPQPCWKAPPTGTLKVNMDVGWSGCKGTGFGLVIRDEKGSFQAVASHYVDHRMDPIPAETLCLRWCLQMVGEWNLDHLIISSDCHY
ncbi:uncharacterized protein LOC130736705 [Lotus japonicus]|uniref:uncharacterized protein LOC130736705 n=1 Tax=Lotus japonicus TaxID=34305 RepID=UPI002588486E|nr:uncharacterized protein LOC130736705 [Lotus japonicus]